jgi:hypothetical protein
MTRVGLTGGIAAVVVLTVTITATTRIAAGAAGSAPSVAVDDAYKAFNPGRPAADGFEWVQAIVIRRPELRAEVKGNVKVEFQASGMTAARALCWQQSTAAKPEPWGHDVNLAPDLKLDAEGKGSFVFPADEFPNGPVTVRILARSNQTKKQDVRELQLFNAGGVAWKQGIPKDDPPAAAGMKRVFADDFDAPLSISADGKGKRYMAHKPGGGDFSGYPFAGPEATRNPFSQKGTYLRIHASRDLADSKDHGSTGLIAPVDSDGKGFYATAPFYMECRFVAQSAPGTWPAFWAIAKKKESQDDPKAPTDELDVIEAYGGAGDGNPNGYGLYEATSHFWNQSGPDGKPLKLSVPSDARVDMTRIAGGSSWSTTFHTYGLLVTHTDTVYLCDGVEVLRHPTNDVSKSARFTFLINYAVGGISGWKIDLKREGGASDMWVDYVTVYQGE